MTTFDHLKCLKSGLFVQVLDAILNPNLVMIRNVLTIQILKMFSNQIPMVSIKPSLIDSH